jgi:hypothetical protein
MLPELDSIHHISNGARRACLPQLTSIVQPEAVRPRVDLPLQFQLRDDVWVCLTSLGIQSLSSIKSDTDDTLERTCRIWLGRLLRQSHGHLL